MDTLLKYIHFPLSDPVKTDSVNPLIITYLRPASDVSHHYQGCILGAIMMDHPSQEAENMCL